MDLPAVNPDGYVTASISNVTGFHNVDFLFAHGSADDNVHYANSAHLLDMLTREKVRNYRFRMFTDRYFAAFIPTFLILTIELFIVIILYIVVEQIARFTSIY
jgi:hypothetical protein